MLRFTLLEPFFSVWPQNAAMLPIYLQCHNERLDTKITRNKDGPILVPKMRSVGPTYGILELMPKTDPKPYPLLN